MDAVASDTALAAARQRGRAHLKATLLRRLPRRPGAQQGGFCDTGAFRSKMGNLLSMSMQFHIAHQINRLLPLIKTPAAYWTLRRVH